MNAHVLLHFALGWGAIGAGVALIARGVEEAAPGESAAVDGIVFGVVLLYVALLFLAEAAVALIRRAPEPGHPARRPGKRS